MRQTHVPSLVGIIPPGVAAHIREIYTSCDFLPSCLPYCLFSYAPAQAKRKEIISRRMAQKTQFGVRKCPHSKCFSLICRFGVHFAQNPPQFRPPSREIQQKQKVE